MENVMGWSKKEVSNFFILELFVWMCCWKKDKYFYGYYVGWNLYYLEIWVVLFWWLVVNLKINKNVM